MKKKEPISDDAARLREKAEKEFSRRQKAGAASKNDADTMKLLHELQVHQIELEMQNESMRQITEKAEHAAMQYADLYEEIYDYSPSGYFTLDRLGLIRKLNLSGASLLERERSNLIGGNFHQFIELTEQKAFEEFLEKIFATQAKASCEIRLRFPNHPAKVVHIESRIAEDENLCLLTAVDITERVKIENELRELNARIQKDAVIKAELLNEVNHRVKNNLMMIIGLILAEKRHAIAEKSGEVSVMLEKIEIHIRGLLKVHQMLSDRQWAPMRISELAHHICSIVLESFNLSKGVALQISESSLEVMPRQANHLALILNELTVNTLKYAFQGAVNPAISIDIAENNGMIVLEYRDNGSGFASDVIDEGRQRVGLKLIKQLVEDIPGELELGNDSGALVKICFPSRT